MLRSVNRLRAFVAESQWVKFVSSYDTEVSPRHLGKGEWFICFYDRFWNIVYLVWVGVAGVRRNV